MYRIALLNVGPDPAKVASAIIKSTGASTFDAIRLLQDVKIPTVIFDGIDENVAQKINSALKSSGACVQTSESNKFEALKFQLRHMSWMHTPFELSSNNYLIPLCQALVLIAVLFFNQFILWKAALILCISLDILAEYLYHNARHIPAIVGYRDKFYELLFYCCIIAMIMSGNMLLLTIFCILSVFTSLERIVSFSAGNFLSMMALIFSQQIVAASIMLLGFGIFLLPDLLRRHINK